jgi:NAD(P)-dependent dehydrogenase (short-subunit alcohol dehydrogenase family)
MPSVLVTGAARGIGRATTLRLAAGGWQVLAGVRKPEDGVELAAEAGERVTPVHLDITDADHLDALTGVLPEWLDAVVNNAGVVVPGPVEGLDLDDLRRQLEVNVVGQVAVTQAVLPKLRASRGRIVYISSLSGRVATPLTGAYNASKFALEGIADSLRMELKPWGISVSLVEPAMTDTDMWRKAPEQQSAAERSMAPQHRELYERHLEGMRRMIPRAQRMAKPADTVAAAIERALTAAKPKARYVVGLDTKAQAALATVMPQRVKDAAFAFATGTPSKT